MRYLPLSDPDRSEMLRVIGAGSIDERVDHLRGEVGGVPAAEAAAAAAGGGSGGGDDEGFSHGLFSRIEGSGRTLSACVRADHVVGRDDFSSVLHERA